MLFEGFYIPLTTPFHPDGRLHLHKLGSNVARYSKTPAAGLMVLGGFGEATLLSDEETREVLRTAAEAAAAEKVLVCGVERDSVRGALELAEYAATLEYDAVAIGAPTVPVSGTELLTFFRTIADRSPLPLVLRSRTARSLALATVVELSGHPNICALLTADHDAAAVADLLAQTAGVRREVTVTTVFAAVTGRMAKAAKSYLSPTTFISADMLAETYATTLGAIDGGISTTLMAEPPDPAKFAAAAPLRTRTKTVGFQVIAAETATMLDGLSAGAGAIAPAFAAAAPQACYEVFAAWKDEDQPLAEEKQTRLREAAEVAEAAAGALKYCCDLNGYFGGLPRLPLLPPTGELRGTLEEMMKGMHN
jgi:dihydrodipicolinate synthase/N-acetylneuraminate lyase